MLQWIEHRAILRSASGRSCSYADCFDRLQIFVAYQSRAEQKGKNATEVAADYVVGCVGPISIGSVRVVRMTPVYKLADSIEKEKLRRRDRRRVQANRRVNVSNAALIPTWIERIEIRPTGRISDLDATTKPLSLYYRICSVAKRADRSGVNSIIVRVPNVDRGVWYRLTCVSIDDSKSKTCRQSRFTFRDVATNETGIEVTGPQSRSARQNARFSGHEIERAGGDVCECP